MATATYSPRLKDAYEGLRPQLQEELGLDSIMQVPRIEKITLNMGVGDTKTDAKALDSAIEELTTITTQRAQIPARRKSIAAFKLREGMAVGAKVTLRGARMYEFLDRLVSVALPRIRDFRGLNARYLDGRGNYSLGVREQVIFPEIDSTPSGAVRDVDITITTTAETDEQALALLRSLGLRSSAPNRTREPPRWPRSRSSSSRHVRRATRCAPTPAAATASRPRAVFKKFGLCRSASARWRTRARSRASTKSSW